MSISNPFSRLTFFVPFTLVFLALGLAAFLLRTAPPATTISPERVAQARLAPGTEGLTRQVALHISKLTGGGSVGGFPPFRPPNDDEKYKRKISERAYTPEEANYWIKELNNFLGQVANKNTGMTLQEILVRQDLTTEQANDYVAGLRDVYRVAEGMSSYGVNEETFQALSSILTKLGVLQ